MSPTTSATSPASAPCLGDVARNPTTKAARAHGAAMFPSRVNSRPGRIPSARMEKTPIATPTTTATSTTLPALRRAAASRVSDGVLIVFPLELDARLLAPRTHVDQRAHVSLEPAWRVDVQEPRRTAYRYRERVHLAARSDDQRAGGRAHGIAVDHELELALENVERVGVVRVVVRGPGLRPGFEQVLAQHQVLEGRQQYRAPERLTALPILDVHRHRVLPLRFWAGSNTSIAAGSNCRTRGGRITNGSAQQ